MFGEMLQSLILLLLICTSTISEDASNQLLSVFPDVNNASCGSYSLREANNSSEATTYCNYPDLFSTQTLQCDPFSTVECGNRPEPRTPCDYPNLNCSRPKGENVSLCTCENNPDLNYDMCSMLPDGVHVWPARHWSPFYVKCTSQRTIPTKCDGPSVIYNFFQDKCQFVYEVVNAAYSLSLSIDIPQSLYHLISLRPTDAIYQPTLEITKTAQPTATQTKILTTPDILGTYFKTGVYATTTSLFASPSSSYSGEKFETRQDLLPTTPPLSESSLFATSISVSVLSTGMYATELSTRQFALPTKEYLLESLSPTSASMSDLSESSNEYSIQINVETTTKTLSTTDSQLNSDTTNEMKTVRTVNSISQSIDGETKILAETTRITPTPSFAVSAFTNTMEQVVFSKSLVSASVGTSGVSLLYESSQPFTSEFLEPLKSVKTIETEFSVSGNIVSDLSEINPLVSSFEISSLSSSVLAFFNSFTPTPSTPKSFSSFTTSTLSSLSVTTSTLKLLTAMKSPSSSSSISLPASISTSLPVASLSSPAPSSSPSSLSSLSSSSSSLTLYASLPLIEYTPSQSSPKGSFSTSPISTASIQTNYQVANIKETTKTTMMTKVDDRSMSQVFTKSYKTDYFIEQSLETISFQTAPRTSAASKHSVVAASSHLVDELLVSSETVLSQPEKYSTELPLTTKIDEKSSSNIQVSQFVFTTTSDSFFSKVVLPASATVFSSVSYIRNKKEQFSSSILSSRVAVNVFESSDILVSSPGVSTAVGIKPSSSSLPSSLSLALLSTRTSSSSKSSPSSLSQLSTFSSLSPSLVSMPLQPTKSPSASSVSPTSPLSSSPSILSSISSSLPLISSSTLSLLLASSLQTTSSSTLSAPSSSSISLLTTLSPSFISSSSSNSTGLQTSTDSSSPLSMLSSSTAFSSHYIFSSDLFSSLSTTSLQPSAITKVSNLSSNISKKSSTKSQTKDSTHLIDIPSSQLFVSQSSQTLDSKYSKILEQISSVDWYKTLSTSVAEPLTLISSKQFSVSSGSQTPLSTPSDISPSFKEQLTDSFSFDIIPTKTILLMSTKLVLPKESASEEVSTLIRPSKVIADGSNMLKSVTDFKSGLSTTTVQNKVPASTKSDGNSSELKDNKITSIAVGVGVGGGIFIIIVVFVIVIVVLRKRKKRGRRDFFQIRLPPELFMTRNL